ncbi:MAG: SCO family protein [Neptuniibacter caesariensis]|uniref:SCO family protein n=1 Tax=Neptuniibacter caesariensis TaxID=207954 RepID=A0A2G6JQM6_NEPCE|nr:MAG: SCO family protein [Neptuniibacter caesariensis]
MTVLRNLLLLTALMLVAVAIAFYLRPQPLEQRLALGEQLGGEFTLQAKQGDLKLEDYRGKVVLFFIGYASCPDICPTALAMAATGLYELTDEEQSEVVGIFMSVDPERDSVDKLATFAHYFHPNFIGATSDRENIDKIVKQYGAFYRKVELDGSAMGYAIDHSARIYFINKEGKLAKAAPHTSSPAELANEIRNLL